MTERQRVVVGVDGSVTGAAALRWAMDEAARRGADVEIVTCWHPSFVAETSGYGLGYLTPEEMSADARSVLDDALAAVDAETGAARADGRDVVGRLLEGTPGPTLVTEAKGADILVVGRTGHNGLARLVVGSVSRYATNHAACPVVVVPEP